MFSCVELTREGRCAAPVGEYLGGGRRRSPRVPVKVPQLCCPHRALFSDLLVLKVVGPYDESSSKYLGAVLRKITSMSVGVVVPINIDQYPVDVSSSGQSTVRKRHHRLCSP